MRTRIFLYVFVLSYRIGFAGRCENHVKVSILIFSLTHCLDDQIEKNALSGIRTSLEEAGNAENKLVGKSNGRDHLENVVVDAPCRKNVKGWENIRTAAGSYEKEIKVSEISVLPVQACLIETLEKYAVQ